MARAKVGAAHLAGRLLQHLVELLRRRRRRRDRVWCLGSGDGAARGGDLPVVRDLAQVDRVGRREARRGRRGDGRDAGVHLVLSERGRVIDGDAVVVVLLVLLLVVALLHLPPLGCRHAHVLLLHLGVRRAEHVTIQRPPKLIHRRLAPAARVVPVRRAVGDGRVQARDLQVGVRRRRPIPLHIDQPRRRSAVGDLQRLGQLVGEHSGSLLAQRHLKLLALIVDVAVAREVRLRLELEKGVVQHLIVDVNLAHLGLHALLLLALELLRVLLLHDRRADPLDARRGNELGQLEGRLLDTALAHQKLPLLAPVLWHGDRVAVRFEMHKQPRVGCSHVPLLDHFRLGDELLELSDGEALELLLLLLRHLRVLLLLLLLGALVLRALVLLLLRLAVRGAPLAQQLLRRVELAKHVRQLGERRREREILAHRHVFDLDALLDGRRAATRLGILCCCSGRLCSRLVGLALILFSSVALVGARGGDAVGVLVGVRLVAAHGLAVTVLDPVHVAARERCRAAR
mmetsp:Transcript_7489/g.19479  ORF Transcript_7489/g.19479 Transcript_7489/m.19479 type:complete len:515 (+) Transcript_7489:672-2216(+)